MISGIIIIIIGNERARKHMAELNDLQWKVLFKSSDLLEYLLGYKYQRTEISRIHKLVSVEYTYWATCVHGPRTAVAASRIYLLGYLCPRTTDRGGSHFHIRYEWTGIL